MLFYFAPMEGVTNYIYRNTYSHFYSGIDKYFAPFIDATEKGHLGSKFKRELLPENNQNIVLVPQLLTNKSINFNKTAFQLKKMGYWDINLNLGCPSGTVVTKGKGSGQLKDQTKLRNFLDEIFEDQVMKISVKTRIGFSSPDEMKDLIKIFNDYPIKELIVHPRIREDFYKGPINLKVFKEVLENSKNPVCYNGDLFTVEAINNFTKAFPTVDRIMLGRGLIANPGLIEEYKTGKKIVLEDYKKFHDYLLNSYSTNLSGDRNTIFKMKEYWVLWGKNFPDKSKEIKKILKSQNLDNYNKAVKNFFMQ